MADGPASTIVFDGDSTGAVAALHAVDVEAKRVAASLQGTSEKMKGATDVPDTAPNVKKLSNLTEQIKRLSVEAAYGKDSVEALNRKIEKAGGDRETFKPLVDAYAAVKVARDQANAEFTKSGRILDQYGNTAKGTAAALRQVPAQFTDIIVSLQGGQAPLTVLLQQGGQLKDVFGGVGNAAKALGGYVLGLVNPFTIAAAAVAGIAYAYKVGSEEADAYNRALILSGNSAGVTAGQLQVMAERIGSVTGTTAAAAESLAAFAQSGAVSAVNIEKVSAAASRFSTVTGTSIKDIVSQFNELKKAPLEASLKLNESTNFLTESLYQQIKALEEQGRTTEAADLAQQSFAATLNSQAESIVAKLGTIERAWLAIKNGIKDAGDAILNIGRIDGLDAQIKAQRQVVEGLQRPGATVRTGKGLDLTRSAVTDETIQAAKDALAILEESARIEARRTTNLAEQKSIVEAKAKFEKDGLQYLDNAAKREREIAKVRQEGLDARASEEEIAKRIAAIEDKYKDKTPKAAEVDKDKKAVDELVESLQKQLEKELELSEVAKVRRQLGKLSTTNEVGPGLREYALELANRVDTEKQSEAAAKASAKAYAELNKEYDKLVDGYQKSADGAAKQVQKLEAEEKALVIAAAQNISLAQAIEEVELARLREKQAAELNDGNQEAADAIKEEIAQREKLVKLIGNKESREISKKSAEDAAKEWKRAAEKIEDSITDALLRGFENGKGFIENLRDTIVNTFKTMVLRPVVQGVVSSVGGAAAGALGLTGSAAASTLAGGAAGALGLSALGSAFGASLSAGFSATISSFGAATGVAIEGGLASIATGTSGAIASGLGQIAGALAPFALAGVALYGLLGGFKGEYVKSTGDAQRNYSADGLTKTDSTNGQSFFKNTDAANTIVDSLQKQYASTAKALGIGTVASVFNYGSNNSDGGKFAIGGGAGSQYTFSGETKTSKEALELAASQAIFAALKGSDLPGYIAKVFDGITAGTATQEQIDTALNYAGTLKQIRDALTETRTPLQILKDNVASAFTELGTSADTFKTDFVDAIDAGITPEKLSEYLKLGQNLEDLAKASAEAADGVAGAVRSLADIANERKGLQRQLDELTLSSVELLAKQREAIDDSNKSLFDQVQTAQAAKDAADALAEAQAAMAEKFRNSVTSLGDSRFGLENEILGLQGNDAEVRKRTREREIASLTEGLTDPAQIKAITEQYDYNEGLRDTIKALQDAQKAQEDAQRAAEQSAQKSAQAAEQLRAAWQSITDSIFDEVKRIRALTGGGSAQSFASAQADFSIAAAQASAGDQGAAKALPQLSRILLELAETNATSLVQLRAIQGTTAGTLEEIAKKYVGQFGLQVPQFAVGTNYVPKDMLAVVHEGEAIIPAAYNPSNGGASNAEVVAELQALRLALKTLQAAADATAKATTNSDKTLTRVTRGGDNMVTKDYTVA